MFVSSCHGKPLWMTAPKMESGEGGDPYKSLYGYLLWMDEIHFAPKKPWHDDPPANTQQTMVSQGFKAVRNGFHPCTGKKELWGSMVGYRFFSPGVS